MKEILDDIKKIASLYDELNSYDIEIRNMYEVTSNVVNKISSIKEIGACTFEVIIDYEDRAEFIPYFPNAKIVGFDVFNEGIKQKIKITVKPYND